MLPSPSSPVVAGIEAILVAAAFLAFGYLLADAVFGRSLSSVARWGLAVPALAAYSTVLMVLHIASGGRVLSNAWLIRGLTLVVAATLSIRWFRRRSPRPERGTHTAGLLVAGGIVLIACAIWSSKVFRILPLTPLGGDIPWHMGLATQLLNGETTPSATVTGAIPNYYPWLYHGIIALLARFTPGGRAFHALGPLQFLHVAGIVLALFALGREITGRWMTGATVAFFGAIAGAIGRRYPGGGTLRPYNVAFFNQSPPFPREIAVLLLLSFLLLLVAGLNSRRTGTLVAAGVALGLAGLTGAEAFFVGMGVSVVVAVLSPDPGRLRTAAALIGPALAIYGIWLVPLAVSWLRLGGFVNITVRGPVNLTAVQLLIAWGLSLVLGAFGVIRSLSKARADAGIRTGLILVAVAGSVLLLSVLIPESLGESFLALGRRHRYWPLLHLGVAIFAGLGASELLERAARRHIVIAVAVGLVIIVLTVPSALRPELSRIGPQEGSLRQALRGSPDAWPNVLAPRPGWRCVAAAPLPMDTKVFSYTGYRLVLYQWSRYTENLARIRWKEIYEEIPGDAARLAENKILVTGAADPGTWGALARTYGVDVVLVPERFAGAAPFEGFPTEWAVDEMDRYLVVWVDSCGQDPAPWLNRTG